MFYCFKHGCRLAINLNDFSNIFNFPLIIFSDFIFYTFQSLIYYITKFFDFFYVTTIFNFYSIFFCILDNCCIMGFFSIICPLFFFWKPSYFCCCITHNRFGFSPVYILIIIYSVLHFVFVLLLNFFVIYQKLCVKLSNFWFFCLSFLYIWNYLVFIFVTRSLWSLAVVVHWYEWEFSHMCFYLYGIHMQSIVFFNFCNLPWTILVCSCVINLFSLCLKHVFVINVVIWA